MVKASPGALPARRKPRHSISPASACPAPEEGVAEGWLDRARGLLRQAQARDAWFPLEERCVSGHHVSMGPHVELAKSTYLEQRSENRGSCLVTLLVLICPHLRYSLSTRVLSNPDLRGPGGPGIVRIAIAQSAVVV